MRFIRATGDVTDQLSQHSALKLEHMAASASSSVDKSSSVAIVKNAIHCIGQDKLLKCEVEMKEFEQEILLAGDVEQTVFEEFCTKLTYLLQCLISSTDNIKLYSTYSKEGLHSQLWKNVPYSLDSTPTKIAPLSNITQFLESTPTTFWLYYWLSPSPTAQKTEL